MQAAGSELSGSGLALAEIEADLPALHARAARAGWEISFHPETLSIDVKIVQNASGEVFLLRGIFDQYRSLPPVWDFVDLDTGEAGTRSAYPRQVPPHENPNNVPPVVIDGGPKGQVICLPCNRLAYKGTDPRAPHDWNLVMWADQDPRHTTIVEMVSRINQDIQLGKGRWAPRAARPA